MELTIPSAAIASMFTAGAVCTALPIVLPVWLKKTGATDGGKPIRAVCGLCEKQFGFLSGFIMTFVTAFPIMFLSIYYSFSDR